MGGQQDCTLRTRASPKAGPVGRTSVQQARLSWRVWDHVGWSLRKRKQGHQGNGGVRMGECVEASRTPQPQQPPPPLHSPPPLPALHGPVHVSAIKSKTPNPPHPSPLLPHSLLKPQPAATTTHQSSPPAPASPPASPPRPATHLSLSTCAHTHPPRRHGGRYTLGCRGRACPYRGPPPLPPPHQPHPSPTRRRP